MKKLALILTAVASAALLTACQGEASDPSQPLDQPGVAPYEYDAEAEYLLNVIQLDFDLQLLRFRSPEGAKSMAVTVYRMVDGQWQVVGGRTTSSDLDPEEGLYAGTLTVQTDQNTFDGEVYGVSTLINMGGGAIGGSAPAVNWTAESSSGGTVYLEDYTETPLGEEVPVQLTVLYANPPAEYPVFTVEDYFTPDKLAGADFAQAVTVMFTDEMLEEGPID